MSEDKEMREALFTSWDKDRNQVVMLARADDAYEIGFQAAYFAEVEIKEIKI